MISYPSEETWTIENAVDLDGTPIDLDNVSIGAKDCIPYHLTDRDPDREEGDDRYYGNVSL
jgi:hypothetical protein